MMGKWRRMRSKGGSVFRPAQIANSSTAPMQATTPPARGTLTGTIAHSSGTRANHIPTRNATARETAARPVASEC